MSDLCHLWQTTQSVNLNWYFEWVQKMGGKELIFNHIEVDSAFTEALARETFQHHLIPHFAISAQQFRQASQVDAHLRLGVKYTILMHEPLSIELVERVQGLQEFLPQMKFVVLARTDGRWENLYRSIPHFMRRQVCVDFPMPLQGQDPFWDGKEREAVRKKIASFFLEEKLDSFCPDLALYNEWGAPNVNHFSEPRKLATEKPKISIIALSPDALRPLQESAVVQKSPQLFEVLITRVAGRPTKVIPPLKSLMTTRYWAHPMDEAKPVSDMVLANVTATKADGEWLVFLDEGHPCSLDTLFSELLEDKPRSFTAEGSHVLGIRKTDFMGYGGFDSLLQSLKAQKISLCCHEGLALSDESIMSLFDHEMGLQDYRVLIHRYPEQIPMLSDKVLPANLSKELDLVAIKKQGWNQLKAPLFHWYRQTPLRLVLGILSFFLKSLSPLKHFVKTHGWKLNPKVYRLWWVVLYFPNKVFWWGYRVMSEIWGLCNKGKVTLYWSVFKVLYPMRKIYYFLRYQYEKRWLGLHQKRPLRESDL